ARELLGDGRPGIKLELPACQAELVTTPHGTISAALAELGAAREQLVGALGDRAAVLACGTHPFAAVEGPVNPGEHYERVLREYGSVARRQLVCGMHVHVALPGAERVLAVYNALRGHLPLIAALAANAPLHDGRDTGLASVRPLISGMLPRQGVPPAFASFEELAADLGWGNATKRLDGLAGWWWELRLHAQLGTIEIRVPDVQTGLSEACAVAAVAGALAAWLAERHDAGDLERPVRSWRIAENRWSAARDGARGELFDLRTGRPRATAELLSELLAELRPTARVLGAEAGLDHAARLIECGGADRQRALLAATGEPKRVVAELVERYAQTGGAPSPAAASGR
ncbi:MAG TPA: YbdK family carboxylate-amine ligase, partial [Solirubrobacteraceae bacterium]|nr:YbdK family carboxylate-amine ligase [Solirubrobacteraceae bacterium]